MGLHSLNQDFLLGTRSVQAYIWCSMLMSFPGRAESSGTRRQMTARASPNDEATIYLLEILSSYDTRRSYQ